MRGRFLVGKASYVEASINATESSVSYVLDPSGRSTGRRLLAHHRIETRPPRTGPHGWSLFSSMVRQPGAYGPAELECACCGHVYILRILLPGSSLPGLGDALGEPASFSSDWFSFLHEDYRGQAWLSCRHCEERTEPRVSFPTGGPP